MKDKIITVGLIFLVSLFVIFLRISSISLTEINKLARLEVFNESLQKAQIKANERYPNLPLVKRAKLVQKFYKDYLRQNKYSIVEKTRQRAKEKKAFYQNDNNHTYMVGIDSYYWQRLIDNLIKKGQIGDRVVNGVNYDDLVGVPIEQSFSRSLHLILGSFIYKIFGIFKLDVNYEIGLFFIPLLFSVLLVILTFFVTKLLCKNNVAAFFATIAVNLSPLLLQRIMGEWLDTDIYNVFFPLLIFWAFLFVFKSARIIGKSLGLFVFSFACSFYAGIWQGWWHIFDLFILCGLLYILNGYYSEGKDSALFKKNILWLSLLFISGILVVGIFNGKESVLSFISEPKKLMFTLKNIPTDNWPNVFLTVAELKKVSPYSIAQALGGLFIFFTTILGSIYLVLSKKIIRDKELGIGFFCLFIWLGILYYASLSAVRFALLLIVPLGIMFGVVFDMALRKIFRLSAKFSKKIHFFALGVLIIIIYSFVSLNVSRSIEIANYSLPMMNDAWYKSLTFIKNNTAKDEIVNSWWDYGHWFTAIAQRRVLFDGKTQNSPIAFWMAKVLITDNEQEAVGILRMLDISKNKAFGLLESSGLTHAKAVSILRDIVKLSEKEARQYLEGILEKKKIDEVIPLLFNGNVPPACFIASYDMIGKIRSISHIGNWDFKRGDMWLHLSNRRYVEFMDYAQKEYGLTKEKASNLLRELALLSDQEALGWISKINTIYADSFSAKFKKQYNLLLFDNGLVLDLSNFDAYIMRGHNVDIGIPYSVFYMKDGVLEEKKLEGSNVGFSVLLFKADQDSYNTIFLDRDLAKSLFVRMYFLNGEGLKYFKVLHKEKTQEGNLVYIYDIQWPK